MRKIYVASSWRNPFYPHAVKDLLGDGHEVYDFRKDGFRWIDLHPSLPNLAPRSWLRLIEDSEWAVKHFEADMAALHWCDTLVLVLPAGRSAAWESGWALGRGKDTHVMLHPDAPMEAELMILMFGEDQIYHSWEALRAALRIELPAPTPQICPPQPAAPTAPESPKVRDALPRPRRSKLPLS